METMHATWNVNIYDPDRVPGPGDTMAVKLADLVRSRKPPYRIIQVKIGTIGSVVSSNIRCKFWHPKHPFLTDHRAKRINVVLVFCRCYVCLRK